MSRRRWAVAGTVAAVLSAAVTVVVVHVGQRRYQHAFAFRIAVRDEAGDPRRAVGTPDTISACAGSQYTNL